MSIQTPARKKISEILSNLDLNISSNPKGTDKGDLKTYVTGFYEKEFATRQTAKNRLLEIGVRSGASVALWANYFKEIEIIGVDVEDIGTPSGPLKKYVDYPFVKFYCKDAYSEEFANEMQGKFSILLDDGPHSLSSQIRFIELYLSKLDEDGVLIIEDVQRAYRDSQQLMMSLPPGDKYLFETFDFRSVTKTGDDFLFVIRFNKNKEKLIWRRVYIHFRATLSWLAVPHRRIKKMLLR